MQTPAPRTPEQELALLRQAARISGVGGWEFDLTTRTLAWTDEVYRIHEIDPATFSPTLEAALSFYAPESRPAIESALKRAIDAGERWDLELRLATASGRVVWVRTLGEPVMRNGKCIRVAGSFADVSATRAERELEQARDMDLRKLALVAQHTNDVLIITDADDRIEWVNRRFVEVTGYTPADASGRTPRELLIRPDSESGLATAGAHADRTTGAPPQRVELKLYRRDGSPYWAEVDVLAVADHAGRTRQFVHVQRDVTWRRQSQAQKAVLLERYETIGTGAGIGYCERDFETGIGYWDAQTFRLHGLPERTQAPPHADIEALVLAEDRARYTRDFDALRTHAAPIDIEYRIHKPDGTVAWLHLRAWSKAGADGRPVRAIAVGMDVTDRKRAELRNLELSRRLALATAAAGVALWEHSLTSDEAYWNDEAYALYGLDPAGPTPSRDEWRSRFVFPEDRARQQARAEEAIKSGRPYDHEHRIVRTDGAVRWVHSRVSFLAGPDGKPDRALGVTTDVTERKLAEQQLRETLARLQLASAGSGVGIFERSLDMDDAYWSDECFRLYGLSPAGRAPTWDALIRRVHPDDREMFRLQWDKLSRSRQFVDSEFRIVRSDLPPERQERWLLTRGRLEAGADGRGARVVGVAIDITDLRWTKETLQGARDRLALATEASRIATWERDRVTGEAQWDPLLFRFFGLAPGDHAPSFEDELQRVHPDDVQQFAQAYERTCFDSLAEEWEYRVIRPDGTIAHLFTRAQAQFDAGGAAKRVLGVTLDVSESRRTSEQLHQALARLRVATEAGGVGTFERNPVTGEGRWDATLFHLWGRVPSDITPHMEEVLAQILAQDRESFLEWWRELQLRSEPLAIEYRIRRADGTQAVLMSRARCDRALDGTPLHIMGATIDVTAERAAQARLSEIHELMQLASHATGVGFFRLAYDGSTVYADRQTCVHYGLDPDGPTPRLEDFKRHILPEDHPLVDGAREKSLTATGPIEAEYRVRDPGSGSTRTLFTRRVRVDGGIGRSADIVGAVIDVTQNRAAQRALAASSERLALATRTAGVGIWEWNPDTGLEQWDARMREIYGITDPEWPPSLDSWRALVHPDDRERAARPFTVDLEHLSGGESEHRIVRPDGEVRTVLGSFVVERDRSGAPIRVLGTDLDITEARRAQFERDALSRRLDMVASEVGIGVWEWDIVRNAMVWNDQMYALFGRTREQFSNRMWLDAVHDDDREATRAHLNAALHEGPIFQSQFRVIWPDGSLRWIVARGRVERAADGEPLRLVGVNWDITDLFRADIERRQLNERINIAAAGAGIGFWHFIVDSRTPYADDQTIALYGRARAQDPEFARHWLQYVHEDDRARVAAITERVTQSDEPAEAEYRVVWPDARIRHLALRARRSIAVDGRGTVVNGVNWDITEQRMNESAVRAKETAERASAAKTEFLSRMSHELRTPLNAILGFAQILEIDAKHPLDESQRNRLAHIQTAGWHLLTLINEILDLSRIEAGRSNLNMSAFALGEVIDECLHLVSTDAARRHITLHPTTHADGLPQVWADRVRVKQILLNLLANAVKYNRDGGAVRVQTRSSELGHMVIGVRDTGPGLSAAQLDDIFQPFNRLGLETASIEGTGIGLTISQKLAEQMGGALEVSSEVGVGSEFRVTLQAAVTLTPPHDAHGAPRPARTDVIGSVLYVEDNPANVSMMEDLLSLRPGVKLFTARDGASARVLAAVCQPDLALLDLRLPDTDGIRLIAELHAAAATREVPCVAVSANAAPSDVAAVRRAGFVDFWPKPINVDQLLAGIDYWLTRQPMPAE